MYNKIILTILLLTGFASSQVFAASEIYTKPNSPGENQLNYKFSYDEKSVIGFISTRIYCGAIYLFLADSCFYRSTNTGNVVNTNTVNNNTITALTLKEVNQPNTTNSLPTSQVSAPPRVSTFIPSSVQPIYQVIERIIERAIPGPQGPAGKDGANGKDGISNVSGGAGTYFSNYISGAQYGGSNGSNQALTGPATFSSGATVL